MTPDRQSIERIKQVLLQAKDITDRRARETFLDQACDNDAELRKEVESLLAAYETADELLRRDASGEALLDLPDLVDTVIDGYRLVERIGEGGFGEVYRAEQTEPLRREVALKIIKLGMDTKNVVARFEAERQALARLNHPGIAQVYDAGATESGRPYFVMELVRGVPVTEYCDRHRLPMPERIELFRRICNAVQYAHQEGILHRDLKPSNILVTEENGEAQPKIIDFGVAKSLEGRLTEQTLVTLQEMLIGTPMYMSPEQLSQGTSDVDTRSDIYSLGIILYELLAGTTPLDHKTPTSLTMAGMRKAIETADLPRPSKRIRTMGSETTVIANARQVKPPSLERLLRGDLDWIVMKAIEKEPQQRYDDATAFSEDLGRYLRHETVSAGAPGLTLQFRKFIRRHKTSTAVSTSIVVSLLIGALLAAVGIISQIEQNLKHSPIEIIPGTEAATPFIKQRGWKLESFYHDAESLLAEHIAIRPDGTVLFSSGWWDAERRGVFIARKGDSPLTVETIVEGDIFAYPTGVIELPEGIYVATNPRMNSKLFRINPDNGTTTLFCDSTILNPFGITVAPDTFDGPNVDPGDLLVFDNGLGSRDRIAIWAVSRETGAVRPLIKRNSLNRGFLNGSFGPDGMLYAGLNDAYPYIGAHILRISPHGDEEIVLEKFYISEVLNDPHEVNVAVHPVTGEVFFTCRNKVFAFIPGKTRPHQILSIGRKIKWADDGSRLYITHHGGIWVLSGPGIESQPVSTETDNTASILQYDLQAFSEETAHARLRR